MKQEEAYSVIDLARQDNRIVAELDTAHARRYRNGGGYRVRLMLRTKERIIYLDQPDQLPSVLSAWNELSAS